VGGEGQGALDRRAAGADRAWRRAKRMGGQLPEPHPTAHPLVDAAPHPTARLCTSAGPCTAYGNHTPFPIPIMVIALG